MIKQDNFSLQKNCNIEEPLISELQPNLQLMSGKAQKSQGDKSADPGGNSVSMKISWAELSLVHTLDWPKIPLRSFTQGMIKKMNTFKNELG